MERSWRLVDSARIRGGEGDDDVILQVKFSAGGDTVMCGSSDRSLRLLDVSPTGLRELSASYYHNQRICAIDAFSNDPYVMVSCDEGGLVVGHDKRTNDPSFTMETNNDCYSLAVGQNDTCLAIGMSRACELYDIRSLQKITSIPDYHSDDVLQTKFHPRNLNMLATGGEDGLICLFDLSLSDNQELEPEFILNADSPIRQVGFFSRQPLLYCLSASEACHIYDIESGTQIMQLSSFSSDGYSTSMTSLVSCFETDRGVSLLANYEDGLKIRMIQLAENGIHNNEGNAVTTSLSSELIVRCSDYRQAEMGAVDVVVMGCENSTVSLFTG